MELNEIKVKFSVLDSSVLLEDRAERESQAATAKWTALPYLILKKKIVTLQNLKYSFYFIYTILFFKPVLKH